MRYVVRLPSVCVGVNELLAHAEVLCNLSDSDEVEALAHNVRQVNDCLGQLRGARTCERAAIVAVLLTF